MDETAPVLAAPAAVQVAANAQCQATGVDLGDATATDNCTANVEVTNDAPETFELGETTVTYTAVDAAGNTVTATQTVTVVDETAPVLAAPAAVQVAANAQCQATGVDLGDATATDNCTANVEVTNDAPETFELGETTVTYTAVDAAGNTVTATQTVTVVDETAPVLAAPAAVQVAANAQCQATGVDLGDATATDNCTANVEVTNDAPETFELGETTVTYTAVDAAGNTVTATQTVTVVDETAPVLAAPAAVQVAANAQCQATGVDLGDATATDNCTANVEVTNDAPETFELGETTVTYTAVDAAGNTVTATQTVTVVDETAPVLAAPAAVQVAANAQCQATGVDLGDATATDNCTANVEVTNDAPETFELGETTVTYTAVDAAGNTVTATQTVTVVDETAPVLAAPAAVQVAANAQCQATGVDLGDATATDNCTANVEVTNDAPETFELGETTVTYTAVDAAGNTVTATQTVTVVDETAPVLAAPAAVQVAANAQCQATGVDLGDATATDNCTANVEVTNDAPETFELGETTVTYTAVDAAGNTVTATQTVTVVDETAPVLAAPAAVQVAANAQCQATGVDLGDATATDNCTANVEVTNDAPETFELGETTVTYTAVDAAGNTVTATQTVTVVDETAPVLAAPAAVQVAANAQCQATGVDLGDATATDNCTANVEVTNDAPETFELGETTVTYTAVDAAGNTVTATQTVTVVDETAPVLAAPAAVQVAANAQCQATGVDLGDATATDNCTANVEVTNDAPETFELGETTVTYTAVDAAGNTVTATQTVTVVDETAPVLAAPAAVQVAANAQCQATGVDLGDATATDNCTANVEVTNDAPETFELGETTVTYTAVDAAGNTVTATQTVTVVDETAPVLAAPAAVQVAANAQCQATGVDLGDATATDNCTANVEVTNDAPETFELGETTVTYTAVDAAGNTVTATQTVTVVDETAPVLAAPAAVQVAANAQCQATGVDLGDATATDNCTANVEVTNDAPETFELGETTVTYTAVDAAGNTVTATQTVTVVDETAPVLAAPAAVQVAANAQCQATGVDLGDATATDNCTANVEVTNDAPETFELGETTVTYTAVDAAGNTVTATQTVTVVDETAPVLAAPAAVQVAANAQCQATGVDLGDATATDNCTANVEVTNDAPETFELGETTVTYTAVDAAGNTVTATQTVTVVDETAPVLAAAENQTSGTNTGTCTAEVSIPDAEFTDNCAVGQLSWVMTGATTNSGTGQVGSYTFNQGVTTITYTGTDVAGNSSSDELLVTVTDDEAPVVTVPANITVKNDAGKCTAVVTYAVSASDNCSTVTPKLSAGLASGAEFPVGTTTVTYETEDEAGNPATASFTVTVENANPTLSPITGPAHPVQIGTAATLSANYTDNNLVLATFTFSTDGEIYGNPQQGVVSNGTVSGSFNLAPGVYNVKLVVSDACGATAEVLYDGFIVIYDPNGGFVTGGGWIYSNPGSMPSKPLAEGRATFGFNAKYKSGKNDVTEVDGSTNFQFRDGDFHFKSTNHTAMSLVVAGRKATYRGEGTVNGEGKYEFMVSVIDGNLNGGDGIDRFRIRIVGAGSPKAVVYDNELGIVENADATTAIGSGSIVIHNPNIKSTSSKSVTAVEVPALSETTKFSNYPNPFNYRTTITFSTEKEESFALEVYEVKGALVQKVDMGVTEAGKVYAYDFEGHNLPQGVYFARLITASGVQTIKMVLKR
ncbi:HYR domain-containing protein [Pontibacter russatus]|uniref:HYR domain-containing protein n=1 Tax=Pontibacter russatus TaxID=2694929 RepID=UPI00137AE4A5|nr:HYR domain-containing protein [Pontibacter russatus]